MDGLERQEGGGTLEEVGSQGALPRLLRRILGHGLIHHGRGRGQDLVCSGRSCGRGLVCCGRNLRHDLVPRGRDHGPRPRPLWTRPSVMAFSTSAAARRRGHGYSHGLQATPSPRPLGESATGRTARRAESAASGRVEDGARGPSRGGDGHGRGVTRRARGREGGEGTPPRPRTAVSREGPAVVVIVAMIVVAAVAP